MLLVTFTLPVVRSRATDPDRSLSASHVLLHVFGPLWGFQLTRAWALQATAREVIHLGPSPLLLTFSLGVQSRLTHS